MLCNIFVPIVHTLKGRQRAMRGWWCRTTATAKATFKEKLSAEKQTLRTNTVQDNTRVFEQIE
eukprot:3915854-Amphidinium_carterae.1